MPSVDVPIVPVAKPNPRNDTSMFKIFQNVQYNVVQHKKYIKEMVKLYRKLDEQTFRESFKNALQYLFTFGDASGNVDRVIQFVASFCTSLDDEEEFLLFIFEIIFDCQCVSGQSVRFRASQLLAAVLSALGEDASLDDDLCDKLLTSQMQRLQDTRGAVRCRAALALQRLQCPTDSEDEVTRAYRFHMSCDPSASVRRAIVMTIAKCSRNTPFVLERLCDVDEGVRRAAFLHIAAINVTQLRVRQRLLTLKVGLTERSPRVRRVVEEILIPGWLSTFQGNIINLLKAIRLDNAQDASDSQYVAGKLLESLFKRLPVSELLEWLPTDRTLRLIPADKLNKETAWYWRHLAEHLHRIDDDETLEMVLPDLVVLAGYIRAILEAPCSEQSSPAELSRQPVLHELARMLRVYDTSDVAARQAHHALVTDALTGDYGYLSPDVIRAFVSALELVVSDVSQRVELVRGVISALRDPPEPPEPELPPPAPNVESNELKLQRARLRVSLNVAMEAQEEAVRDQNYALAADCKAKVEDIQKKLDDLGVPVPAPPPVPMPTIKEKLSDSATLNKCLLILNCSLDTPQLKSVTPMLKMIFDELEVDIFQNPDVLETALETVALYGMLDKNFAKENKAFFFANLIDTTNEKVVSTVLKCIMDLLCVHGAKVFEDDESESINGSKVDEKKRRSTFNHLDATEEDGSICDSVISLSQQTHTTVIELLLKMMDSTCANYRLIIVEGLCRMIHLGHLESPAILSRLLLLWFNPATVDEDMLRQTIGVFFQTFPACVDGAQEQIQKATIPTMKALANAPSSSPLAEIDQEAVVKFIVTLTRFNHEVEVENMLCHPCWTVALHESNNQEPRHNADRHICIICHTYLLRTRSHMLRTDTERKITIRNNVIEYKTPQQVVDSQGGMAAAVTAALGTAGAAAALLCRLLALLGPPRHHDLALSLACSLRALMPKISDKQSCRYLTRYLGSLEAIERASLNKMSHTDVTNGTMHVEDTIQSLGRVTSLPAPLARSTHVVINETVEEEVEIDETSPCDVISRISEESNGLTEEENARKSTPSEIQEISSDVPEVPIESDSSDVSPVKKVKVAKGKKTLSTKKKSFPEPNPDAAKCETSKPGRKKVKDLEDTEKGIKRSRSQRSVIDVDKAKAAQQESKKSSPQSTSPLDDLDVSNVTVRRSTRPSPSRPPASSHEVKKKNGRGKGNKKEKPVVRKSRSSSDSVESFPCAGFDNSADETELHTIVYDQDIEQSLLQDSDESKNLSKGNVTIPETPDASEESDPEPEPVKKNNKRRGKGKKT